MEFNIEKASQEDACLFAEIILKVWEEMEQKEWFVADAPDYTREKLLEGKGMGYKAVEAENGMPAGVFLVTIPGESEENLGNDLGMPLSERQKVAHMETAVVLSRYRGNHLQYRMMQEGEGDLRQRGYRYLMCTIHPENTYSLSNALKQGYQIMATKEKYGGYLRHILLKNI